MRILLHKDRLHSTLALVLVKHNIVLLRKETTPPALVDILLKIINLVNYQLINFLNHRKKGKKRDFQKPNINSITCRSLMIVVVVTHCWNQDMITYEKLVFGMWKNQMNEMICFIELASCSLRSSSMATSYMHGKTS
jgi:hypothetical protein